jgi:hypothetical protein
MAVIPRVSASGVEAVAEAEILPTEAATLSRLKALHSEAEETALLANLLGRSLYATMTLALASAAAIALANTGLAREAAFGVLMLCALGALMRAYRHAIAVPFERAALRSFAEDLNAIFLYAGFAWGAGAFLALAADAHPVAVVVFSAGVSAVLAAILRRLAPSLNFIVPVAILTALSALARALPGNLLTALAVLGACAAVAGAAALVSYREALSRRVPLWSDVSLA